MNPIQFPELSNERRYDDSAEIYPVHYTYKTAPAEDVVKVFSILSKYLCRRLKYRDVEDGGILGISNGMIAHYYRDHYAQRTAESILYAPDDLNWIIHEWNKIGTTFGGLIHCHPAHRKAPSTSDLQYVAMLLTFNPQLPSVLLCIVADGLNFYRFERDFLTYWEENHCLSKPTSNCIFYETIIK